MSDDETVLLSTFYLLYTKRTHRIITTTISRCKCRLFASKSCIAPVKLAAAERTRGKHYRQQLQGNKYIVHVATIDISRNLNADSNRKVANTKTLT